MYTKLVCVFLLLFCFAGTEQASSFKTKSLEEHCVLHKARIKV